MDIETYRITLKVHPMVLRYFDNNFPKKEGAYDLTESDFYPFVSSLICRSNVKVPSLVQKSYKKYRETSICITEYDFYHYGYYICELQQMRFSNLLRLMILDEMCRRIAMLRAAFKVPLNTAVQTMIDVNLMEPDELTPANLRKTYQRKYAKMEKEYYELFRDCVTDYGTNESTFEKKNMIRLSQTQNSISKIWKI